MAVMTASQQQLLSRASSLSPRASSLSSRASSLSSRASSLSSRAYSLSSRPTVCHPGLDPGSSGGYNILRGIRRPTWHSVAPKDKKRPFSWKWRARTMCPLLSITIVRTSRSRWWSSRSKQSFKLRIRLPCPSRLPFGAWVVDDSSHQRMAPTRRRASMRSSLSPNSPSKALVSWPCRGAPAFVGAPA